MKKILIIALILFSFECGYAYNQQAIKYKKLDKVLSEISSRKADYDTYNCTHFSRDAQKMLTENGIMSVKIIGNAGKHEVIGILFEPQTGTFTTNFNPESMDF